MNIAGLVVALAGGFFVVVALRGTQHAALPGLFPVTSSSATTGNTAGGLFQIPGYGVTPGGQLPTTTIPGVGGNIPIYAN